MNSTFLLMMSAWGTGIACLIAYAVVKGQKKPELIPIKIKNNK